MKKEPHDGRPQKTPAMQLAIVRTDMIPHIESRSDNSPLHPLNIALTKPAKPVKGKKMPKKGIGDPSGQPQK